MKGYNSQSLRSQQCSENLATTNTVLPNLMGGKSLFELWPGLLVRRWDAGSNKFYSYDRKLCTLQGTQRNPTRSGYSVKPSGGAG